MSSFRFSSLALVELLRLEEEKQETSSLLFFCCFWFPFSNFEDEL